MNNLINQVALDININRNNFIYRISKLPIIKHLLPKNPYKPNRSKFFYTLIFILSYCFKIMLSNFGIFLIMVLPYQVLSLLTLESSLVISTSFDSWLLFSTMIFALIRGIYRPSFVICEPQTLQTLFTYMKLNSRGICQNNRFLYFIFVILNRLILSMFTSSMYVFIGIILMWYAITFLVDSLHMFLFTQFKLVFPNQNRQTLVILTFTYFILGVLPYVLLVFNLLVNVSPLIIVISSIMLLIVSLMIQNRLSHNFDYHLYLRLSLIQIMKLPTVTSVNESVKNIQNDNIVIEADVEYKGKDFAYLNNIFFDRYKKIYSRQRMWINIALVLLCAVMLVMYFTLDEVTINSMHDDLFESLNYFSLIFLLIYYLNMGQKITNALFFNCDASMLTYRLYNKGSNVLPNFIERLKHMIKIHLVQSLLMSLLSIIVLGLFMKSDVITLVMASSNIILMTMFFCIHSLVIYYLLQPYDVSMKVVNYSYSIVNGLTYLIVYMISGLEISFTFLTLSVIIFSIMYFIIATLLMYFVAPKTFKLK